MDKISHGDYIKLKPLSVLKKYFDNARFYNMKCSACPLSKNINDNWYAPIENNYAQISLMHQIMGECWVVISDTGEQYRFCEGWLEK